MVLLDFKNDFFFRDLRPISIHHILQTHLKTDIYLLDPFFKVFVVLEMFLFLCIRKDGEMPEEAKHDWTPEDHALHEKLKRQLRESKLHGTKHTAQPWTTDPIRWKTTDPIIYPEASKAWYQKQTLCKNFKLSSHFFPVLRCICCCKLIGRKCKTKRMLCLSLAAGPRTSSTNSTRERTAYF